jgi:hypothetical protein
VWPVGRGLRLCKIPAAVRVSRHAGTEEHPEDPASGHLLDFDSRTHKLTRAFCTSISSAIPISVG